MTRRRLAASALMLACGAGLVAFRAGTDESWLLSAIGVGYGLAGLAHWRRSLVAQLAARGAAWAMFVPALLFGVASAYAGRIELPAVGFALGSGLALAIARPLLDSAEGESEFAPIAFRRGFLAGVVLSLALAVVLGVRGCGDLMLGAQFVAPWFGASEGLLAVSLLAAAVGVVRMRAWGVLLAIANVPLALAVAYLCRNSDSFVPLSAALSAIPGLMFAVPILRRSTAKMEARAQILRTRVAEGAGREAARRAPVAAGVEEVEAEPDSVRPCRSVARPSK